MHRDDYEQALPILIRNIAAVCEYDVGEGLRRCVEAAIQGGLTIEQFLRLVEGVEARARRILCPRPHRPAASLCRVAQPQF